MGLTGRTGLLMLSGLVGRRYYQKVRATRPIAYWPLWETEGAVAHDISGNGFHGSYTGVDLGQPGIGDGRTAPFFDGVNDFVNIYSAGLAAAFNRNEGTLMVWAKAANAGVWTDGQARFSMMLRDQPSIPMHYVSIYRSSINNQIVWRRITGSTEAVQTASALGGRLDFMPLVQTWSVSSDEFRAYSFGQQVGATITELSVWEGRLAGGMTCIGANSTSPAGCWHGWLAHVALWDRPLTPGEVARLARV